jgi:hypothetical protein
VGLIKKKNQPHLPIKNLLVSIVTIIIIVVERGIKHDYNNEFIIFFSFQFFWIATCGLF